MDNLKGKIVAYQGLEGSYTYECLVQNIPGCIPQSHMAHGNIIKAVQDGDAEYALLPMENSIMGRVSDVHHMLMHSDLKVLAEFYYKVNHCLLAIDEIDISEIENVHSMAPALSQCRNFLQDNNLNAVPHADTTGAAKMLGDNNMRKDAAIASEEASKIYNLKVLKRKIQDIPDNTTRFFLLGKAGSEINNKSSNLTTALFFTVKNIPAALFKSLSGFATNGVNVIKLESFMPMYSDGLAQFYIEISGDTEKIQVKQALEELGYYSTKIEILGTFGTVNS